MGMIETAADELRWLEREVDWESIGGGVVGTISFPEWTSVVIGFGMVEPAADDLELPGREVVWEAVGADIL